MQDTPSRGHKSCTPSISGCGEQGGLSAGQKWFQSQDWRLAQGLLEVRGVRGVGPAPRRGFCRGSHLPSACDEGSLASYQIPTCGHRENGG